MLSLGTSLAAPRPFKINLLARPWRGACACSLRTTTGLDGRRFSPIVAAPRFGALRAAAVELGRNPIEGSFREADDSGRRSADRSQDARCPPAQCELVNAFRKRRNCRQQWHRSTPRLIG